MLFGMADPFQRALQHEGDDSRLYAPRRKLLPGMAYLVRRLLRKYLERILSQKVLERPCH